MFTGEHTKVIVQRMTGMTEEHSYAVNATARKTAHVLVYGLLGIMFHAFFRKRPITYAWGCATLAAVLDEWHQSFVPGRSPLVRDVLLDSAAALLFIMCYSFLTRRKR